MKQITIKTEINKPLNQVWEFFNNPEHIVNWNFAHESWECSSASNDLQIGGKLSARMQAKDGSFGFDFVGTYDEVNENKSLKYHLEDGRKVEIIFKETDNGNSEVTETFDPETENPVEFQKEGWQAILDNFKNYSENN